MAVRGFFSRHRILAGAVAPAALGVAALVAVAVAVDSPQSSTIATELTASVTECHDMVSIGVAGRGDTPVAGTTKMLLGADGKELPAALSDDYDSMWVDPVIDAPAGSVASGSYSAIYIAYPANMDSYEASVLAGVENTQAVMRAISASCPNTQFSIVGYSEGADVVRRVAVGVGNQESNELGIEADKVVAVVIFADAGREAGDGTFLGATDPYSNPDNFDTKYQNGGSAVPGQGLLPDTAGDFGTLNGKVASFCSDGDFTCAAPSNISLLILAANVGRQLNVDSLEKEQLTPATGQDVALVMSRMVFDAFSEINATPDWMQGDQTFLEVILKVSDPAYVSGSASVPTAVAETVTTEEVSPLAYLPEKLFKEIAGLIATNSNTIPVVMSDPYQATFGADMTGHHFDYWDNADTSSGQPLTSAQYSAAWLTYLAKQAQEGKQVDANAKPTADELALAVSAYMAEDDSADTVSTSAAVASESAAASATASPAPVAGSSTSSASVTPTGSAAATSKATASTALTSSVANSVTSPATTTTSTTTSTTTATTTTTTAPKPAP